MDDKRQLLLDTALSLFYENGINSVGINQILQVSGVAKKTLYNHFESKTALVLAVLKQRSEVLLNWLESRLAAAETDRQLVVFLFAALDDWFSNKVPELGDFRGCFFINSSAEFSDPNSEISIYCQQHKHEVRELVAGYLPKTQQDFLDSVCILMEGAISTAYVSGDLSSPKKCVKMLAKLQ